MFKNTESLCCSHPFRGRSRFAFSLFVLASLLVYWLILRVILIGAFRTAGQPSGDVLLAFGVGAYRDLFVGVVTLLPTLIYFFALPERFARSRWQRMFFWGMGAIVCFYITFLGFTEFYFFDEFHSRFNTVAVDYLVYPKEVFVNIWESYHVGIVVAVCSLVAGAWLWTARRFFRGMFDLPYPRRHAAAALGGAMLLAVLLLPGIRMSAPQVSENRNVNELANNGWLSFVSAAWTHHLDYAAFYRTINLHEAYQRARQILTQPNTHFVESGNSIHRVVEGDPSKPRLNVVVILEESLGAEFWGCLGRKETLTPEMDRLALSEGLLFTNMFASGNRTVRGMEGVLSSFPPLPGDSIVKRDRSDNVESLARVLKRDGYSTLFLYGGRGIFDSMRSYAVRNGYDRFIEQADFEHPVFTTAWGVSDEDLFQRGIQELNELSSTRQPFFATFLTVSNHRPYTYPEGRIPEDPNRQFRVNAVKYSDYALGQFFRAAKEQPFWTNTVFVVVADHGARVYGKQAIPLHSYEIPLVVLGPAVVKQPRQLGQLGCSLDVAPTVLGLIGRPYESLFFGRDLLQVAEGKGRAWLNHNRDVGMITPGRMFVLGLMKSVESYYEDAPIHDYVPRAAGYRSAPEDDDLLRDTMAVFEVADDLYTHQRYALDLPSQSGLHASNVRPLGH